MIAHFLGMAALISFTVALADWIAELIANRYLRAAIFWILFMAFAFATAFIFGGRAGVVEILIH